jgi:hypothetical protein
LLYYLYAVSGPAGATLAVDLTATPPPNVLWRSKKIGPFIRGDKHLWCIGK